MGWGLIGRDAELRVVETAVARLRDDRGGGGLAITGAAGVGKSRLAREALARGRAAGATALVGRAVPSGSTPYRPLVEALSGWARTAGPVDLAAHDRAQDVLRGGRTDEPLSPEFVAEALLRLLPSVAAGPVLLLLEDLHWAESETLAAVEYLADAAETLPLLLVATAREDQGLAALRVLRSLAARGVATAVSLSPLDRDQTRQLAEERLGSPVSPALTDLLLARTDGLPLFVEELLAVLPTVPSADGLDVTPVAAAILPTTIADTVAARLASLTEEQQQVVEAAALLGRSFDHELLGSVHDDATAALQAATRMGLLHEDPDRPGRLRFKHALLRDGVVAATFPPTRQTLARALLAQLPDQPEGDELSTACELAIRAGDTRLATRLSVQKAREAYNAWAFTTAEECLSEARVHAGTDPELLTEIDLQQLRVASLAGRLDVVERVAGALLTRAPDDEVVLIESHLRLAQALLEDGRVEEAEPHLLAAAPLVANGGDDCTVTRLELHRAVVDLLRGDRDSAQRRAVAAADLARPFPDQPDLVCAALLQEGRAVLPDVDAARRCWQAGLDQADAHGLRLWRGRLLTELSALSDSGVELAEAEGLAREAGAVELLQRIRLRQARLALLRGEVEDAETLLQSAAGPLPRPSQRMADEIATALAVLRGRPADTVLGALVRDDVPAARAAAAVHPEALFAEALSAEPPFPASPLLAALCTRVWAETADDARELLLAAIPTLERLGLTRPAEACRSLLRADGVPLPRRASAQDGVPDSLRTAGVTTRELDVLRLIAEGMTNRDIAGALYLSVRTVEKHVERLLLKTGAANRTALAGSLRSAETAST